MHTILGKLHADFRRNGLDFDEDENEDEIMLFFIVFVVCFRCLLLSDQSLSGSDLI